MSHRKMGAGRVTSVLTGVLLCASLPACSGVDNIYHKQGDIFVNWRVKYNPHVLVPSGRLDSNERCPPLATDATKPDLDNCEVIKNVDGSEHYEMHVEGSYAGGLGPAVVHGAAFVAGMGLLGNGIAQSGSTINQTGGGASQSQTQGQGQGQIQLQQGRNHGHR